MDSLSLALYMAGSKIVMDKVKIKLIGLIMLGLPYSFLAHKLTMGTNLMGVWIVGTWVSCFFIFSHGSKDAQLSPISNIVAQEFKLDKRTKTYNFIFWTIKGILLSMILPLVVYDTKYMIPSDVLMTVYMIIGSLSLPVGYLLGEKISEFLTNSIHINIKKSLLGELLSGAGLGLALSVL